MTEGKILTDLMETVLNYDVKKAKELVAECIEKNTDIMKCIAALTDGIHAVGDGFGRGELFLPSLIGAARVLEVTMPVLNDELKKQGKESSSLGKVVIGTVFGDVHCIGKNMVATLLTAEGFEVIDLGINIKAEQFVEKACEVDAQLLALSALLTATMAEQENVIRLLKNSGIRDKVKVIVGGGPVTSSYAEKIGADGYESTAIGAAKLARKILNK
ncbi:MAG: cobalamin-dependent protein [Candidatus Humimicrobiaceae bacterium]